jgi:hypothetical protein
MCGAWSRAPAPDTYWDSPRLTNGRAPAPEAGSDDGLHTLSLLAQRTLEEIFGLGDGDLAVVDALHRVPGRGGDRVFGHYGRLGTFAPSQCACFVLGWGG